MRWFKFLRPKRSYRPPPSAPVELASASNDPGQADTGPSRAELDEVNGYLLILAELFPDHGVDLIRSLLWRHNLRHSESRLETVANILASYKLDKGRPHTRNVESWQLEKSQGYKNAVRKLMWVNSVRPGCNPFFLTWVL